MVGLQRAVCDRSVVLPVRSHSSLSCLLSWVIGRFPVHCRSTEVHNNVRFQCRNCCVVGVDFTYSILHFSLILTWRETFFHIIGTFVRKKVVNWYIFPKEVRKNVTNTKLFYQPFLCIFYFRRGVRHFSLSLRHFPPLSGAPVV